MQTPSSDMTPRNAAALLVWLVEAGADEIVLDQAVNRFDALPPEPGPRPEAKSAGSAALPPAAAPAGMPALATLADAEAAAAACATLGELSERFSTFDINGLRKSAVRFLFIAETPGARVLVIADRPRTDEEQENGIIAGKAAVLLQAMLKSIGLSPPGDATGQAVSLANLVPWRPPGNRNPIEIEIAMSVPFMRRAIELMQPEVILALGALPAKWLASAGDSVAQQRGKWHNVAAGERDVPLLSTFHPFELLSYPERKRLAWRDLLMFRDRLGNS